MDQLGKILSASLELFQQYGFRSVTMDDIARKGGISKKTLYLHFANKAEVVNEAVSYLQNLIANNCTHALQQSENAVEGMVRLMPVIDQIHRKINPMAIFELERFFPEGYKRFKEFILVRDILIIKENILRGISEGLYRPELDADFIARYRMESLLSVYRPNLMVTDSSSPFKVTYQVSELFMHGILTTKGEKLYQKYKEKYLNDVSTI
jgi:AcrR family transcriptional regulator